jgi:hypothetical protein
MVGGYAGLCLLAPTPEVRTAAARVADPPAVPCSMQSWPNADRNCLNWTAPRADGDQAKRVMPTTVGLTADPAIRRQAATPALESDDVAAAQATPPVAAAPAAKARTATHVKTRPLAAVPSNTYAFDGSARRNRQSQGSFFGFGGGFFR